MHPYSIDTEERRNLFFCFAVIGILLSLGMQLLLDTYKFNLPWEIKAPSVLFFYYAVYEVFNRLAWKCKFLRKSGVVKTPDLNGEWDGTIETSFNDHSPELKTTLKISQTWTKIEIILITNSSKSRSEAGSMTLGSPEGKCLIYHYINEPRPNAAETMHIHRGTTRLLFDERTDRLSGEYYSGRDRQNFGSLSFKRKT